MKEDAPTPARPPTKRRALERAPDLWLAVWAADVSLSDADRERVQAVRDARKAAAPDRRVGLILDREGLTPPQFSIVRELLSKARPTEIHHPWAAQSLHSACKSLGVPVIVHKDVRSDLKPLQDVVLASTSVIGAPRGLKNIGRMTPAWDSIKYAKHRNLPVTVVLPDGTI